MTTNTYLKAILDSQKVVEGSLDLKNLQSARTDIENLLRSAFPGCELTIRYGGSKAKGTMILEDYDLDIICYFASEDTAGGKTLKEIYQNVLKALERVYSVDPKTSALRVFDMDRRDLKVDVVPGRFTDDSKGDAYLFQKGGEKDRLKTNLGKHIEHVAGSGCTDIIQLTKLWKLRTGVRIRTFPLELLVVEILNGSKLTGLNDRFTTVLSTLRDNIGSLQIEDPANPTGNDLSALLDQTVRDGLFLAAESSLLTIDESGWESVFGEIVEPQGVVQTSALHVAATHMSSPPRPWSNKR